MDTEAPTQACLNAQTLRRMCSTPSDDMGERMMVVDPPFMICVELNRTLAVDLEHISRTHNFVELEETLLGRCAYPYSLW